MSETIQYSIGITTFSRRLDLFKNTLTAVRKYRPTVPVAVVVNGDYNAEFDETYRVELINLLLQFDYVYPIVFPSLRGYAKLVNTLVIHSPTETLLHIQDDVDIVDESFFTSFENILPQITRMCKFNGSFSHACYTKQGMIDLGWMDERLLGFGEEDGDLTYRYIEKYGEPFPEYYLSGIHNIVSPIRDENITPGVGKYSKFNREFMGIWSPGQGKYLAQEDSKIEGMFGYPMTKVLSDDEQYPYEQFYLDNKDKL
jgi:hypothetical protein